MDRDGWKPPARDRGERRQRGPRPQEGRPPQRGRSRDAYPPNYGQRPPRGSQARPRTQSRDGYRPQPQRGQRPHPPVRYDRPQERDHAYERDQRERSSLQNIKIVAGYVAVLALIALLVLFFIFYLYPHLKGEGEGPAVSESDTTASETQEMSSSVNETSEAGGPAEATTAAAEAETQPNAEGLSAGLEIKTLSHVVRFGGRTQGFAIIHNKNAEDVSITGQAKFLKGGATIGTDDGTLNIIGAGQTSILSFASEGEADELNVEIYAYAAPYHADALHMLRAEVKKEGQQAVVTVYNEGSLEAKYVYGHALFYQGGKLVASEGAYFDSGNSSLLPGEELSQEFDPHVDYDEVEFYMTARADKN